MSGVENTDVTDTGGAQDPGRERARDGGRERARDGGRERARDGGRDEDIEQSLHAALSDLEQMLERHEGPHEGRDERARGAHDDMEMRAREAHDEMRVREAHDEMRVREAHDEMRVREAHDEMRVREAHDEMRVREAHDDAYRIPLLDEVVIPGKAMPAARTAASAYAEHPELPDDEPALRRRLATRLASEIDVIVQDRIEAAMESARSQIIEQVRNHIDIMLPEIVDEFMRIDRRDDE